MKTCTLWQAFAIGAAGGLSVLAVFVIALDAASRIGGRR